MFKFVDLFAGIGGLRKSFEAIGGNCVFTSEWDKHCLKTYLANFVCDHEVFGDICHASDLAQAHWLLHGGETAVWHWCFAEHM